METNVCLRYGRGPRHECTTSYCEYDDVEKLVQEIFMWLKLGLDDARLEAEKKLKFALENSKAS